MRIDKLASPGALGFIAAAAPSALPTTAAGAAVFAIAAVGAAAMFAYNLYVNYEERKHAAEIARIEQLHQEYLAKIAIHECSLVAGFPPIFQKNSDGQYEAMSMTDAQVHSIARNALRTPTDIDLVTYHHHIICAIAALKKYYFLHSDKTGITVQVILYLLNILEKLLQFEGYAFDIAYLNALCNFICTYASTRGEISEHFTCLNPVFRHLQYATQKLIQHRETRSQEEMVAELRGTCMFYIDRSIRGLTKFLIPHTEWHLVDCCDPYSLRDGIYAGEYITRFIGPARWTHSQQVLPDNCALTNMVRNLVKFYLQTIDSTRQPTIPQQNSFVIPNLPEDTLQNIHAIFEAHPDKNPAKAFQHTETQQIITALTQFSKLIHSMISFLYFLNELTKMIKNLGTSETDNPSHCRRLYALHQILSDFIEAQAETVQRLFREINRRNDNQMRIAEKECFLRELMQMFNEIKVNIDTQSNTIRERRKAFNKKYNTENNDDTVREHMVEVVNRIEAACNLTLPRLLTTTPSSTRTSSAQSVRMIPPPPPPPRTSPSTRISNAHSARVIPPLPRVIRQPTPLVITRSNQATPPPITPTPPLTAPATTARQATVFPKTYGAMYETAKTKSAHINLQLLHLMLDMMNDYTKNDSRALRILHGSFFHHQIDDASRFAINLTAKLRNLNDDMDQTTAPLVHEQLQLLSDIVQRPGINQTGSFATRVAFIIKKCREKNIILHAPLPILAAAAG